MDIEHLAEEYFTYDARLASFKKSRPVAQRRTSNAISKAPKSIKWPHKSLSPEVLARAGFFFHPTQANPDNVACFLCHRSMDGWEEDDDPLAEHLKHCPDCGWAIVATIEQQDGELSQENPTSDRMMQARKDTFGQKWPHEGKKGWKCKIKQMVEAGWKYTPTPEYDDMATCAYCQLALDGWEPSDKPMDEHYKRSPDCAFFTLINQGAPMKKTKSKRTSKVSRLSTQSVLTVASEAPPLLDLPAEEEDSILTTATNATATKKMAKGKKIAATKSKKTRSKKEEPVEVEPAPEPEEEDFEVKADTTPKVARGRKRKSEPEEESMTVDVAAPPTKRRATRTRGSLAVDDLMIVDEAPMETSKPAGRKGRQSKATRKTSTAPAARKRATSPDDEEIERALEADLDRPLTDDEAQPEPVLELKKSTRKNKAANADHAMFSTEPMEIDEDLIEAEIEAMEVESKPLPKAKGARGKQPRKVSAKQQALVARKAAEAEAQRLAEEEEATVEVVSDLERSISILHSSPVIQPKKQRAPRQPVKKNAGRATRGSVMSVAEDVPMEDVHETLSDEEGGDSGHDTDASMASQSTVLRKGSNRRTSTLKKARAGKKTTRNIEEIVHRAPTPVIEPTPESEPEVLSAKGKGIMYEAEVQEEEEIQKGDIPEEENLEEEEEVVEEQISEEEIPEVEPEVFEEPVILPPTPKPAKAKPGKPRGRPPKVTIASPKVITPEVVETIERELSPELAQPTPIQRKVISPPRLSSPPPKELTPSQSPQSSDAENHPPSSKPSASTSAAARMGLASTPQQHTARIPLAPMARTPIPSSPSKRNVIAGLQTSEPWTAADLDMVFIQTPGDENVGTGAGGLFAGMKKSVAGAGVELSSREKSMSVEEWIRYNAAVAEEKLRAECERMVGAFEREGTRAMAALEGVECVE